MEDPLDLIVQELENLLNTQKVSDWMNKLLIKELMKLLEIVMVIYVSLFFFFVFHGFLLVCRTGLKTNKNG